MTTKRKSTEPPTLTLGSLVEAKSVTRPDGSHLDIVDGCYVLDVPGVHVIDGQEVTVS